MRFPGFIGPSYTLQSVNVDCQNCVNLFPEINQLGTGKGKEVASLVPTPGKRLLMTLADSPVRGIYRASNDQVFVVGGQKLYRVSSAWVATELGTLDTDSGPVSMADNGLHLVVVDGTSGYTWTFASSTFAEISDPDFFAADQVTFLDGYFICNKSGSQQFFISGLYAITWDALDIASAEGAPDDIVGTIAANQQLYMFGSQSIEVFYNSGDADFPFVRIQGAVVDVGCAAAFTIQKMGNALFFLGGDDTGTGIVYRMQGFQPQRISTPAIESLIRNLTSDQIAAATAWTYQQGGHLFYAINLPGVASTWVYDESTQFWHERQYRNLWSPERDRAECHALAHGLNVVGDYETGKLYALDPEVYTDDGTVIERIRTSPHFGGSAYFIRHNAFTLDMETGVGLDGSGQGTNPKAILTWSNDGGHTWSNEREAEVGAIGQYGKRVKFNRLGIARDRVYRVKITDPVKVVLIGADLEVEEGTS